MTRSRTGALALLIAAFVFGGLVGGAEGPGGGVLAGARVGGSAG